MKSYLVDVPVRVNIWIRPNCQKKQFEVLRKARPSILFLQSDGGRNEKEWEAIRENRKLFDTGIDWDCTVYRIYEEENQGLYTMSQKVSRFIWEHVDRFIYLEDDYVPAVSFFRFCAELLEKYKDDKRIEMICGNNVFEQYPDAAPNDYFFTENGWSIWGTATWRDRATSCWEFPLPYADDAYVKKCLKTNLNRFWFQKAEGYSRGELCNNHVPGDEYYHAINSVLYHRLSIVPTKNMISNIGYIGEHAERSAKKKKTDIFGLQVYELEGEIRHPAYVIDDKEFGRRYDKLLDHDLSFQSRIKRFFKRAGRAIKLVFNGKILKKFRKRRTIER